MVIEPHSHYDSEWFAGTATAEGLGGGDVGPYDTAEGALVAGIVWLIGIASDARTERDAMWLELRSTRKALQAAQAELRAEREAKGQ